MDDVVGEPGDDSAIEGGGDVGRDGEESSEVGEGRREGRESWEKRLGEIFGVRVGGGRSGVPSSAERQTREDGESERSQ